MASRAVIGIIATLVVVACASQPARQSEVPATTTTPEQNWVVEGTGFHGSKGWGTYSVTCVVPGTDRTEVFRQFDIARETAASINDGDPCPVEPKEKIERNLPLCPTHPEDRTPELLKNCYDIPRVSPSN